MSKVENSVPTYDKLMWPVLLALRELGGSASHRELLDKIIELSHIPESVQRIPHTDGRQSKLSYNLYWAKWYLGVVSAIEKTSQGVWTITKHGRELSEPEVEQIPAKVRKLKRRQEEAPPPDWKTQLLDVVSQMKPEAFERLAQRILRESGFIKVEVKGRSGDGGIDGVGVLRMAGLLSFQVFFQCKRWKSSVSSSQIRDFRGAMVGRTDKGLFITTSNFTPDAQREATRDGAPPIDLIDGDQLCDILRSLQLGIKTVEEVEVDPTWFERL